MLPEDSKAITKMELLQIAYHNDQRDSQDRSNKRERQDENKALDSETSNLIPSRFQKSIMKNKKIIDINNLKRELHKKIHEEVEEQIADGVLD